MPRLLFRLPNILVASAFAMSAIAAPAPVPPAAPTNAPAAASASGLAAGKRMHKPYTVLTSSTAPTASQPCAASNARKVNGIASDPEEGGQVAMAAKSSGNLSVQPNAQRGDKNGPVVIDSSAQSTGCR